MRGESVAASLTRVVLLDEFEGKVRRLDACERELAEAECALERAQERVREASKDLNAVRSKLAGLDM